MKRLWLLSLPLFMLSSCGGSTEGEESRPPEARKLYVDIWRLTKAYVDSIRMAPDSAAAEGAFERFNARLDTVNFSVPPDTDLLLTEGENDTVFMNLMALRRVYEHKLRSLARRPAPPTPD